MGTPNLHMKRRGIYVPLTLRKNSSKHYNTILFFFFSNSILFLDKQKYVNRSRRGTPTHKQITLLNPQTFKQARAPIKIQYTILFTKKPNECVSNLIIKE